MNSADKKSTGSSREDIRSVDSCRPGAGRRIWVGPVDGLGGYFVALIAFGLAETVFAAVHHAEIVAHRVGEPFGTFVLALAVTLIEVALIASVMIAGGPDRRRWLAIRCSPAS